MIPKFRVFDKDEKKMIYNANVLVDQKGDLESIVFKYEANGYEFSDIELLEFDNIWLYKEGSFPYEVIQATGLKDKNDVEIYEGDIVKIENHPFHTHIQIDGNYEVGINERKELCAGGWLLYEALSYASVIGNIYENPELMEVSTDE